MMRRASSMLRRLASSALLPLAIGGCTPRAGGSGDIPLNEARNLIVEIDYMPGAAPSFAALENGVDPWLVFQFNLVEISPPAVDGLSYPRSLAEMGPIDAPSGSAFSADEILDLAREHRSLVAGPQDAHFHVLFFDGTYAGGGESAHPRAVHIGGSRVIAVFGAEASNAPDLDRILEQSALLHEFGHALGLVDLEIPDVAGHSDPQSPGHCTQLDCVMQNAATLTPRLQQFLDDGVIPILFGSRCLSDLAAYYE